MPLTEPELWKLIETWPLPHRPETDHGFSPSRECRRFEDSLRKQGDWTELASDEITAAYRKFLYLKVLSGELITPPDWIDKAWHLHLAFPANYKALEAKVGRQIVHNERLSRKERQAAWDRGRKLWTAEFDGTPPSEMWPQRPEWWRPFAAAGIAAFGIGFAVAADDFGWTQTSEGTYDLLTPGVLIASLLLALGTVSGPHPAEISRCA